MNISGRQGCRAQRAGGEGGGGGQRGPALGLCAHSEPPIVAWPPQAHPNPHLTATSAPSLQGQGQGKPRLPAKNECRRGKY